MKKWLIFARFSALILIVGLLSALCGCYDQREIDELAYPLAIGLDLGTADTLRLTLQLAQPLAIGGGGGGGEGGGGAGTEPSSIITIDTPSLYSGLNLINNIISKEINISHTKAIIFSRKLAESGLKNYLHAIERGREFRPDIFIVISEGPAEEYLKNVKPTLESNPAKYYELLLGKRFSSFYPSTRMDDFYYSSESDFMQSAVILSDLSKYTSSDEFKKTTTADSPVKALEGRFKAGNIPIVSKQKNQVMGMAVFKGAKMIGVTNGAESVSYHLIRGDYNYSYWTIPDPIVKDKIVVLDILQRKKPDIKTEIKNGKATITIKIDLEGDFTSIQSGQPFEDKPEIIEQKAEQLIQNEIVTFLKRTTNEFDSDICGFGRYIKGKFLTWDSWKQFNWFGNYKYTTFNVQVNLNIRRTGLMIRSVGGG